MNLALDLEAVDVMDMMNALGMRNVHEIAGDEIRMSCPFPGHSHGDENPSFCMNMRSTAFICFGCHEKGNAITFLSRYGNISPVAAARFLRERYEGGWREPTGGSIRREIEEKFALHDAVVHGEMWPILQPDLMDIYLPLQGEPLSYMEDRGFDRDTLDEWQFRWDSSTGRIVFPLHDHEGRVVGVKGRYPNDTDVPKYLVLSRQHLFDTCDVSRFVYGLHKCKSTKLVLCEGELDVIRLHTLGYDAVGLSMSSLSDEASSLLRAIADEITIFFDSDMSGKTGTREVIAKLEPHVRLRVVAEHDGDPSDMPGEDAVALIDGAVSSVLDTCL